MYRFTRTAVIKSGADVQKAFEFSAKVCHYIHENYKIELQAGMELFGGQRIHWSFTADKLDDISELNGKLLKDETYLGLMTDYTGHWLEGSIDDTIVQLFVG